MKVDYLHNHPEFNELIFILANQLSINPILIEKDYWIMHCLYGIAKLGFTFQMKGGTSLSKGFGIINRFSEDIDILIEPPADRIVYTGRNQDKLHHRESRLSYYDWLADTLRIDGINQVKRDTAFDDDKYRSGGIRLVYKTAIEFPEDIKEGILLELGFDDVTPNLPRTISSWAYDFASNQVTILDNRAKNIHCYHPGFTFVEKLQTISTKFRKQQETGVFTENFMRHYYDIFCLLQDPIVQEFILTPQYAKHKKKRFREADNLDIATNEAFLLKDASTRHQYEQEYNASQTLYYKEKPTFEEVLSMIQDNLPLL